MDKLNTEGLLSVKAIWRVAFEGAKRGWLGILAYTALYVVASLASEGFSDLVSAPLDAFIAGPLKLLGAVQVPVVLDLVSDLLISTLIYPVTAIPLSFATVGATKISLDIIRGKPFSWARLLRPGISEWMFTLGAMVMVYYLTIFSFMLLIVPGLYFMLAAPMTIYVVVDQQTDPFTALWESFRLMKGEKTFLGYVYLSSSLAAIAGILACVVGIIPAYFVITLLSVVFYEGLIARKGILEAQPNIES